MRLVLLAVLVPLVLSATVFSVPGIVTGKNLQASNNNGNNATSSSSPPLISTAEAVSGLTHNITMKAVKVKESDQLYAYEMVSHTMTDPATSTTTDITSTHSLRPSIPGPTIVIKEGDEVYLTIQNGLHDQSLGIVGVHVHGIHYDILSDGTLAVLNKADNPNNSGPDELGVDEAAPPDY
jgi:FtsP/CotA-like multicopper oxidase with cupredoxin domain